MCCIADDSNITAIVGENLLGKEVKLIFEMSHCFCGVRRHTIRYLINSITYVSLPIIIRGEMRLTFAVSDIAFGKMK